MSDDNSSENVEEVLSVIHDPRFRYCRNEKNLGAHKNWEHSLELGRGEWLYLVMGRDRMHGEHITRLIELLEYARENGLTLLRDGGHNGRNDTRVYDGIEAMSRFIMSGHPTGDVYNGELFRNISGRTRYYEIADMYPEEYIRHYLLLRGKGAFVNSGVFGVSEKRLNNEGKIKSGVECGGNIFDAYYAPRRSVIQRLEVIDMIDGDCPGIFTQRECDSFFRNILDNILRTVSEHWRRICSTPSFMEHYGQSTRYVSLHEMLGNILTACGSTQSHLAKKGTLTIRRRTIILLCAVKALMKCTAYYPMKRAAKRVLKFAGVLR